MQILEVIRTEILINRGMEDRQEVMENITRLNQLIDDEMDKLDQSEVFIEADGTIRRLKAGEKLSQHQIEE